MFRCISATGTDIVRAKPGCDVEAREYIGAAQSDSTAEGQSSTHSGRRRAQSGSHQEQHFTLGPPENATDQSRPIKNRSQNEGDSFACPVRKVTGHSSTRNPGGRPETTRPVIVRRLS